MKTKSAKKLMLSKTTITNLQDVELKTAKGGTGGTIETVKDSACPQTCAETDICSFSCVNSCQTINPNCDLFTHICM